MHPMLNIAIRAARRAGEIITRNCERAHDLKITAKNHNDFVSEVDQQAEHAIIDTILKAYPNHSILAEESGLQGDNEYQWVIDPLDGTTNFLHGFPQFAVSIGLKYRGVVEQGVIYDPLREELFTASRGSGAQLNNRRMRVSKRISLEGALIGTGFPFREKTYVDTYLATLKAMLVNTAGVRRAGAAALDLAYVACGRLDGFWEFGLKEWDMAAGTLMILEAGGMVTDIHGGDNYLSNGAIVTGTPKVMVEMLRNIQPHTEGIYL